MPTPVYDVTSCIPSPAPSAIKQNGYNIWGVLTGSNYAFTTTNPGVSATKVDVTPCLSGVALDTVFNIQIGDHVYSTSDFYKSSVDSKFKCGRPNDR